MAAICVYCSSADNIDPALIDVAAQIGQLIGERGHSLVSGGGSVSMMGSVARSARAAGAHTLGVIPQFLNLDEVADKDSDELITTDTMAERKALLEERSDAFITLAGGIGTLEELFQTWVGRTLKQHQKPVVVCDPTGAFATLKTALDDLHRSKLIREHAMGGLVWTSSVVAALDAVDRELAAC